MTLDPFSSPALQGYPDLFALIRRDGVLLGFAGGKGVAALLPPRDAVGGPIEAFWSEPTARVIRQLVRQALSSRGSHDAVFAEGTCNYEARVSAQGPDRAMCAIRLPTSAAHEETTATGRFDVIAAHQDRRSFLRRFQESLSMASLREQPTAVAVIHLDGIADLSRIMDSQVADQVMSAAVGRIVQGRTEPDQEISWYAGPLGESQIVLVIESRERDQVEALVQRQCAILREPVRVGDGDFHVQPHAGVAILGPDAASPRRLLKNARAAAAEARRSASGQVAFFSDTVRLRTLARLDIAQELREAITERAITLRYLARRDLAGGELTAAVGYLRWVHPLRGEVPAGEFLALAETSGLAGELSRCALKCVLEDWPKLRALGNEQMRISVGPLRQHILDEGFLNDVAALFKDGTLSPANLELRISERALFSCDTALLQSAHRLGVTLIVDEVGRGISSFDVLAHAPLAALQLDRSWVTGLPSNEVNLRICRAGFGLAAALGLKSIARGVDNAEQRDALAALGCGEGIGNLFGELSLPRSPDVGSATSGTRLSR
jgi:EAL domain-containing protein (putative c-di-GMP-specific phosphodiesterase class I)/GGDEF domain-containing protein